MQLNVLQKVNSMRGSYVFRQEPRYNYYSSQTKLDDFPKRKNKEENLEYKLSLCGRFATKNFYCKKEYPKEHLIKTTCSKFFCEIRYCDHPDCLVQRFKRQIETFQDIKRLNGLRKLWHFAVGFEPIPELEFKKNFSKYKKRFEYVLNKYFDRLRNEQGINIEAIRVLDFAFTQEGKVYIHYHFGAIPVKGSRVRFTLKKMQDTRIKMINKMKLKIPFHFQSFGLTSKKSTLSYLAIRSVGMYKYNMTENPNYKHIQGNLRESIKNHKYIFLNRVLTKMEYIKSFYNKSHFVTIGGLPRPPRHGSNITDSIPSKCSIHGELTRTDIRVEVIFEENQQELKPPPDIQVRKPLVIEIVKFY